jgi:hypothetical protein
MSKSRDEAIELPSLGQPYLAIEDLLKRLNDIKAEFLTLQNKIKHNARLQSEHNDFLNNRINQVSSEYIYQVMSNFSFLYLNYEDIKRKLTQFIPADEIKAIEDSVAHAAQDNNAFANLMFFPQYQDLHSDAVRKHADELSNARSFNAQDIWINSVNYSERVKSYRTWYFYTGLLSIVGIGIPLLLGGVVAHIIDKISVKLANQAREKAISSIDRQLDASVNPGLADLQAKVNIDTESVLRQGFFALAKQRYERVIREVDSNHNKLAS